MFSKGHGFLDLASRYRLLFAFPAHSVIVAYIGVVAIIASTIFHFRVGSFLASASFFGVQVISTLAFNRVLHLLLVTRNDRVLSLRRMNGVSLVNLFVILACITVGTYAVFAANTNVYYTTALSVGLGFSVYLMFLVYSALSSSSSPKVVFFSIIGPLAQSAFFALSYSGSASALFAVFVSSMLLGLVLGRLTMLVVDRSVDVRMRPVIELFRSFLMSILAGINEPLEQVIGRFGKKNLIDSHILLFRELESKAPIVALVIPSFHPGPLRAVGSSNLPYRIESILRRAGIETIVLHGLADHTMNIAGAEENERVLSSIVECINSNIGSSSATSTQYVSDPRSLTEGQASSLLISFKETKLATITVNPNPMEDIPTSVIYSDLAKKTSLVIIDTHNSFHEGVTSLSHEAIADISRLIERLQTSDDGVQSSFRVGFARRLPSEYGIEDGLGPGGIAALLFETNSKRAALLILDGNNALPFIREKTMGIMQKEGVEMGELLTTDSHIVSGIYLGGRGYHPIGEITDIRVLEKYVQTALRSALSSVQKAEMLHIRNEVHDVKVLSKDFYDMVKRGIGSALKVILWFIPVSFLLLLTISLLGFHLLPSFIRV